MTNCGCLPLAGNKVLCGHSIAPPPTRVGRIVGRKKAKLMCQDKGSLTEQQTKGTVTTTIQIRWKHNTDLTTQRESRSPGPDQCRVLPSREWVPTTPLLPTGTPRDVTWYGIPCSVWPGGVSPASSVSLPGSWWKLTLSWPNPGQSPHSLLFFRLNKPSSLSLSS